MVDKDKSKQQIKELVDKYINSKSKWQKISESETKSKFLEPLLEYLGWDVKGDEFPDEVIKEERIQRKRADYTLRINGVSKLIVEAKAIKEDIEREDYAQQAITYAYNKAVSWAVLTDFEGLKIFYADEESTRPFRNIQLENIDSFEENFKDIWLLSKESFLSGELDKKAEREGRRKRRINIGEQLFQDLNTWREILSKDIARNYGSKYQDYEIDELVQRIIDRLIFIRKTEDIEIEENQLLKLTRTSSKHYYKQLKIIFRYYNEQYNSKLFGESLEDVHECDEIGVSDDVILKVINGLYAPQGRFVKYNFAAIDADVLGNIYEQYLSHILKKTPKRAKLKEGRAHRKEQGIYYTPTFIVNYIVRNTVGEILKNKKVNPEKIYILDPACGSGSFLLKAFDFLNEYYNKKEGRTHQTQLDESGIFTRKARILKQNIYGVDLDPKAVEIAQLNLLLKLAERKHRLPTLKENIKCGNSLIDDSEIIGDKAFSWNEKFKSIMADGGFEVIIGNPPWGADISITEKKYYGEKFGIRTQNINSFELFLRQSIKLLKEGGVIGFLIPRNFIRSSQYTEIRKVFLENFIIHHILDFKKFPDVTQECVAIIASKRENYGKNKKYKNEVDVGNDRKVPQELFIKLPRNVFNLKLDKNGFNILKKIDIAKKLGDIVDIDRGEEISKKGGVIKCPYCGKWSFASKKDRKDCHSCEKSIIVENALNDQIITKKKKESFSPILIGEDFSRYRILNRHYIDLNRDGIDFKPTNIYKSPKLIMMAVSPIFITAYDENENIVLTKNNYSIRVREEVDIDPKYLLAIFNSKLYRFYQENRYTLGAEYTIFISQEYLKEIRFLDPSNFNAFQKSKYPSLIEKVDKMLLLNDRLNKIGDKKTDERARIEGEIKKTDAEIDELVYQIYGITNAEKKIIEESLT